eukprot:g4871.t1
MKLSAQVFALVLCLGILSAYAQPSSPSPSGTSQVQCSAFAALRVELVGPGRCTGIASANCRAVASSQTVMREAFANWFADEGICDGEKRRVAAQGIARAVAAVYTSAIARVSCTGAGGFACGWAIGRGDAFAISFARAIAQASADTGVDTTQAFCISTVRGLGGVIAEAASRSQARACVNGIGSRTSFEQDFTEQISEVIVNAFASATAIGCSDGESAAGATATCEADVDIDSTPGSTDVVRCTGAVFSTCCPRSYSSRVCACSGCGGGQRRITDYDNDNGTPRSWRDIESNVACACP